MRTYTIFLILLVGITTLPSMAGEPSSPGTRVQRPHVPGKIRLITRVRRTIDAQKNAFKTITQTTDWEVSKTAIIICDMWDNHYCKSAAQRVSNMVPRMNAVLTAARNHGIMIIHAPSGTMDQYVKTAFRKRMQQAPLASPPVPLENWCYLDPKVEAAMPIDASQSPCDDPIVGPAVRVFSRQHPGIDISGFDGVSDRGDEIFNFCEAEGITNIAIMGVHTNMCVLGRPFGIRQLVRLGKNVVLVRDLTDAMYDPREPPYVSHTRGTELVVEHIEKYWCPSITSDDLTRVLPGSSESSTASQLLKNPTQ